MRHAAAVQSHTIHRHGKTGGGVSLSPRGIPRPNALDVNQPTPFMFWIEKTIQPGAPTLFSYLTPSGYYWELREIRARIISTISPATSKSIVADVSIGLSAASSMNQRINLPCPINFFGMVNESDATTSGLQITSVLQAEMIFAKMDTILVNASTEVNSWKCGIALVGTLYPVEE